MKRLLLRLRCINASFDALAPQNSVVRELATERRKQVAAYEPKLCAKPLDKSSEQLCRTKLNDSPDGLSFLTFLLLEHGRVPQAATGLSVAREEAERLASPETRLTH